MKGKRLVSERPAPTWEEWVSPSQAVSLVATNDLHDAIARRAYSYWEARGFQGGSAEQDWLRAEAEIHIEHCANAIMNFDRAHLQ